MTDTGVLMLSVKHTKIKGGLQILFKADNEPTPIAEVKWSAAANDCYIRTIDSRLQDYITTWERYVNFIRLVDEAYDLIRKAYHKKIEQKA